MCQDEIFWPKKISKSLYLSLPLVDDNDMISLIQCSKQIYSKCLKMLNIFHLFSNLKFG